MTASKSTIAMNLAGDPPEVGGPQSDAPVLPRWPHDSGGREGSNVPPIDLEARNILSNVVRSAVEVDQLLSAMTIDEKIAQLCCLDPSQLIRGDGTVDIDAVAAAAPHGIGHLHITASLGTDRDTLRRNVIGLTEAFAKQSRHGVPPLFHAEALNGFVHPSGTQFPTPLALASTWQPEMVEQMADATRRELLDVGLSHALSPNLDITRDPRWGRVHETYGEDPELAGALGVAFVRGLQGDDLRNGVLATAKHFVGYGQSQAGLNHGATSLGPRAIREEFARPFEWAIRQAGLSAVMNSYSELDGVPVVADRSLLTLLLRDRLGFDGAVVSDYYSVAMLQTLHGVVGNLGEAARLALEAGLDVEYPRPDAFSNVKSMIEAGRLSEETVNQAAGRVLGLKHRLGILREEDRNRRANGAAVDRRAHRALSRSIADRALVLLTNDGTLPLKAHVSRVALIGKLAQSTRIHYAAYSAAAFAEFGAHSVDMRDTSYVGAIFHAHRRPFEDEAETIERISRAFDPAHSSIAESLGKRLGERITIVPSGGPEGITDSELAALPEKLSGVEAAIVVVGERNGWSGGLATSGEGRDRQSLDLPGEQVRLVETVASTGIPTVVVLISSRPLDLRRIVETGATILFAPMLAADGPEAIAAALVGETIPAGRLPISWPRSVGQIPIFARSHAGSGHEHPSLVVPGYVDGPGSPLFSFGHGLSYASFRYDTIQTPATADVAGTIPVSVGVTNTSLLDADEVVQVYARVLNAPVARPVRQLVAFKRVHIPSGQRVDVEFAVPVDTLAWAGLDGRLRVEPGEVRIYAGGSRADLPLAASTRLEGRPIDVDRTAGSTAFTASINPFTSGRQLS